MTQTNVSHVDTLQKCVPLWLALELPSELVRLYDSYSLQALSLSVRSRNCLDKQGISSIGELVALTVNYLYNIPAMGNLSQLSVAHRASPI